MYMNIWISKNNLGNALQKSKWTYKDLIIFSIPFLIFLFYLNIYNPGILTYDSFNQMHQIASNEFTNWHPFFHTFIEMLCLKIYPSPISIAILQILVFSTMWTIICNYTRVNDTSNKKFDKEFILQIIFTLFISIIPINAVYSITLWKDILFSYFLMFLCFLIKVTIDKKGHLDYKFVISLSLVMAFVAHLRSNGLLFIGIVLIALCIYIYKKNKPQKLYISIPTLTIIFILLIASLNIVYDVEDNQKDALFAKTAHLLSYDDLNLNLDASDKKIIHEMINESSIKNDFNETWSDPIYRASNGQVFAENKGTYLGIAIKYAVKYPVSFITYLFESSPIVWDITRDSDWAGKIIDTDTNGGNKMFYRSGVNVPLTSYDNATSINFGTTEYNMLESFVEYTQENVELDTLLNSPAFYMYLAIIMMLAIAILTKSRSIYLVYLPNFLNIMTVFFSTPLQSNRYLYSNLLVLYLLVIILISAIFTYKKKDETNSQNFPTKDNKEHDDYNQNVLINKNQRKEQRILEKSKISSINMEETHEEMKNRKY